MKALLVIDSDAAFQQVTRYLKPLGFEFVRYRTPLKAMDTMDEVDPEAVIISAEDFPRHWKTIVQFVRSERDRERTTIVLLKGPTFSYEEAAKAAQIGVNGIASDNLEDREELDRLQNILGRYRRIRERRSSRRVTPGPEDRVVFILADPGTGLIVPGKVTSLSSIGIAFEPVEPHLLEAIPIGTVLPECSLRLDEAILSPICRLVRTKPSPVFSFDFSDPSEKASLENYLQNRAGAGFSV